MNMRKDDKTHSDLPILSFCTGYQRATIIKISASTMSKSTLPKRSFAKSFIVLEEEKI